MSRKSKDGKSLKRILEWVFDRDVADGEIAGALQKPPATYSRYKDSDNFPTFEDLELVGNYFRLNPRWLQVEFGYLDVQEVDVNGDLRVAPEPREGTTMTETKKAKRTKISDLGVRTTAPPLGG